MPRIDIERLPDDARIWVFGISPRLSETQAEAVLARVDRFLDDWSAHGAPITSAREIRGGSFLIVAVDRQSETSGCSIDRMFGLLQALERELQVSMLDANRVFTRLADGEVAAVSRSEFGRSASSDTVVFDTLAERLGAIRGGGWERPAAASWHRSLLS